MPRVKQLIRTDPRQIDLAKQIGGAAAATGKSYRQLCRSAGLEYGRFGELWAFLDACARETGGEI